MCVGDSFTYGGSLFAEKKTYPVLLQQRLDSSIPESGFRVINKGVCESNTGDLNRSLPGWVDSIKPDIVILLIGAANRFTPWDYEYYRNKGTGSHLKSIIFDLRVVKMARIIWLNLKAREVAGGTRSLRGVLQYTTPDQDYITTNYDAYEADLSKRRKQFDKPEADNPIHMLWYYNNAEKFEEGIKYGLSLRDDNNADEIEAILALADLYYQSDKVKELEALLAAALAEFPKSQKTHNGLSYYYAEIAGRYRQKSLYETAIESYLKAISFDPNEYDNYYWLIKLYDLQSYYDSFDVHSELERMMEANAILSGSKLFTSNLNLYHDKQQWEKDIEQWVHDDLERIAKL